MPFDCPSCRRPAVLEIISALELPADSRSDEITVQIVQCGQCGFKAAAVYQELRRGAWGSELFEHIGYMLSEASLQALQAQIAGCPTPGDTYCTCPAHRMLASEDAHGRWNGLSDWEVLGTFVLATS